MILPGGDPDAGMPADQVEIHGIELDESVPAVKDSQFRLVEESTLLVQLAVL